MASYAINVDSKAALLAIANTHTNHPIAVAARLETKKLHIHHLPLGQRTHWSKRKREGRLPGKRAASYNTTIDCD